jgi:hypothetical protein
VTYEVSGGNSLQEEMWDNNFDKVNWAYELADKLGFERCGEAWTDVFNSEVEANDDEGEEGDQDGPGDIDISFL